MQRHVMRSATHWFWRLSAAGTPPAPHNHGLLVPPKDAAALGEAIRHLLERPDEARRMGEAGLRRAVEMYDERLVQARFVGVFDRLLKKQDRSVVTGGCARA